MKNFRFFTLLICLVLMFCSCSEGSSVEGKKWEGDKVRGTALVDEDCPVLLERETVTFDLPEFPYLGRDSAEKYLAYPGRVTTEYHFYNPTDEALTVRLAFLSVTIPLTPRSRVRMPCPICINTASR